MSKKMITIDGNSAVAHVAHATNEVIAIYPITPSSGMGEIADAKSAAGEKNIWGTIPVVSELQSEGGAAGAVHGALSTGALTTTFTASQGLLLMIPNMYKIAGELTPTVFHVTARSLACQALSIFCDHSDVMSTRSTGFALFCSGSIQEATDFALIAQSATLRSRVPFMHFFDGFRTSHEIQKVELPTFDEMRAMLDDNLIEQHRLRALSPDRPFIKGTSQNPDVYFQARETVNQFYMDTPAIVQEEMDKFAKLTGRQYHLFDYVGAPDAERIIVIMGSGAECVHELVEYLTAKGEKVGVLKVRLYRPFDVAAFAAALPKSVRKIAVLDRTKEPGSIGEPLYLDVRTAIGEAMADGQFKFDGYPVVVGGRYGLGSKEFNPAMAKAVFDNLKLDKPRNHFTVGIEDDVTHTSLDYDQSFDIETKGVYRAMFYGLGADGTVSANKNSIKIIGENTNNYAQGYFVYDSKKAGAVTISHLRFGAEVIRKPYLIRKANFVACHKFSFLEKFDMLYNATEGATFLLNSPFSKDEVWDHIPSETQKQIIDRKIKVYVIDGTKLAHDCGLGERINVIMQTAFFAISNILPIDQAVSAIKGAIKKTYGQKGEKVVKMNLDAVETALKNIYEVPVPSKVTAKFGIMEPVPADAPAFVKEVIGKIIQGKGDSLPVSKMPIDGTFPTATARFEKRNIAVEIPEWDPATCVQCGQCSLVCPHASIRIKAYDPSLLKNAPANFKSIDAKTKDFEGMKFTVQIAPEDCTGCGACVFTCPASQKDAAGNKTDRKAINMIAQAPLRDQEVKNYQFFLSIPDLEAEKKKLNTVKGSQLTPALFEYSGACAGCGETAYVKLLTQLFGDRAIIANATGCSSIYGGNLPTTPYCTRADGRGPAWSNSLFEDNAEFALGMRLTVDKLYEFAVELSRILIDKGICADLLQEIVSAEQTVQDQIEKQRKRVAQLKSALDAHQNVSEAKRLLTLADYLVKKSVWALGGDGWAYDIGYGGLDHVLASGKNVNVLVLDTEVYSNTGGQMSKSTPRAATAKFASAGKLMPKKDLGMIAMSYGTIYVAKIALGANPNQAVRAFMEAEAYDGPSLIIAYAHCIAHGINMTTGLDEQKKAVNSGHWPLFRYNPMLSGTQNPLQLDSREPSISFKDYAGGENRYRSLYQANPEQAEELLSLAEHDVKNRFRLYQQLASIKAEEK
ncbi:MAG: pyruvate:ferredoxin (flavodoxin) oxidoreductase [Candidatus Auribacter fodinae]|jgi:pyruvate-ferredoxin/flavodoxin oxidoreductase|uniref:Pyruvate:ferredoxin (Flavodoxin) oxidoreductase n=1 Tax=Candidatus Auribacter fodinae TaxID=2093366 RepID=A0A3A4RFL1_9BACT|nr:MAG: pyruvate:ferredoxin (flavodoxin) oxidoreductase [Candidatus Auribacter fodinae]